jgi:hypothetical protein
MNFKMCIVDEVENSLNSCNDSLVSGAFQDAKEDLLHRLILCPCPLRGERDSSLEMTKSWMMGHCSKPTIQLLRTTIGGALGPFGYMITEHALMELVQDVGSDAVVDITVREVTPKGVQQPEILVLELLGLLPSGLLQQDIESV